MYAYHLYNVSTPHTANLLCDKDTPSISLHGHDEQGGLTDAAHLVDLEELPRLKGWHGAFCLHNVQESGTALRQQISTKCGRRGAYAVHASKHGVCALQWRGRRGHVISRPVELFIEGRRRWECLHTHVMPTASLAPSERCTSFLAAPPRAAPHLDVLGRGRRPSCLLVHAQGDGDRGGQAPAAPL